MQKSKNNIWSCLPKNKKRKNASKLELQLCDVYMEYKITKHYLETGKKRPTLFGDGAPYKPEATEKETIKREIGLPYKIKENVPWSYITHLTSEGIAKRISEATDIIKVRFDEIKILENIRSKLYYHKKILKQKLICEFSNYYILEEVIPDGMDYVDTYFKYISNELSSELKKAKKIMQEKQNIVKRLRREKNASN